MAKILVLAKSGFGKTTAYCGREKYDIKGLDPATTFVIQCINRDLPNNLFKLTEPTREGILLGNRVQVGAIAGMDRFKLVAQIIEWISSPKSPFKNIIVDD